MAGLLTGRQTQESMSRVGIVRRLLLPLGIAAGALVGIAGWAILRLYHRAMDVSPGHSNILMRPPLPLSAGGDVTAPDAHMGPLHMGLFHVNGLFILGCILAAVLLVLSLRSIIATLRRVGRNVEEREAALRQSEQNYHMLFSRMLDGFALHEIICDAAGKPCDYRFLSVNPAFEALTGLKGSEIIGKTVREVIPDIESHWIEAYGEVALTGRSIHFENFSSRLQKDFEVTAFQPTPGQFACILIDVTDRRRAEQALRESEHRFQVIADNVTDVIWVFDLIAYRFVYVSQSVEAIRDFTVEEVLRQSLSEVLTPASQRLVENAIAEGTAEFLQGIQRNYVFEVEQYKRDGSTVWFELKAKFGRSEVDGHLLVYGTSREITDRHRAQEEQALLQAKYFQAQKMESVGRLAGGVAHDFNNMLSVILGSTDMAMRHLPSNHPVQEELNEIRKAGERSARLTRQLLGFARKQAVHPENLDLNAAVEGMSKLLKRLIGEGIELVWTPSEGLWPVTIDPSQVDQMLANLFVNARDAISGVGHIHVATRNVMVSEADIGALPDRQPGAYVQVEVSDSGCGMDEVTMGHLFEPFFTTKPVGEGTGLGLATIYGIVKQNEGFVDVESVPGKGSTFRIHLPRRVDCPSHDGPPPDEPSSGKHQETILLVEDETGLLKLLRKVLENRGYTVLAAALPGEAMRLSDKHPGTIHLLLTDVIMPEMNGQALAERLLVSRPEMRVLYMSGYTPDEALDNSPLADRGNLMIKPISVRDLSDRVRQMLA